MPDEMDICRVCLRTDKKLNVIDPRLIDLHEDLCEYAYYSFGPRGSKFCMECGHLLRKLYNFKEKCILAINILQKWKKKKDGKMPLNLLYTLLPQSALGTWMPINSKVFYIDEEPKLSSNNSTPSTVKPETSRNINTLQPSGTSVNVPRGSVSAVKVPRPSVTRINVPRPSTTSALQPQKFLFIDNNQDTGSNQGLAEKPILLKDIKIEINCEEYSQELNLQDVLKTEDVTEPFLEIIPEHYSDSKNIEVPENNMQIKDVTEIMEYKDDTTINSANIKTDNSVDFTNSNNDDDIETDSSINSDDFREIDEALDDTNIDSDDNDDTVKENKRIKRETTKKQSLDELANITLSEDDFVTNDETVQSEEVTDDDTNEEWKTANKIIAEMENINAELDSINDNYEKILLQSGNTIQKFKKSKVVKKKSIHNRTTKSLKHFFTILVKDMEDIEENCDNIINCDGSPAVDKQLKALKDNLKAKFESSEGRGELQSDKGVAIDKDHILQCLDGRASQYLRDLLWKAINGKTYLTQKAVNILAWIQNKYQSTLKYESVFDIEYTKTPEAMKEEFQRRQTYPWYITAKHKCELCYTVYNCDKLLEKHKKLHEVSAGDMICSVCGVRHKLRRYHKNHMLHHQTVYKCKLCPLITYHKGTMTHHFGQHKGAEYRCEPCDKTFKSFSGLHTHLSYRHRREHVCTTCGRTFETEDLLNTHKKIHQQRELNTNSTSVECDMCELSFPSQAVYRRHVHFTHRSTFSAWNRKKKSVTVKHKEAKVRGKRRRARFSCPMCAAAGGSYGWLVLHGRVEHHADMDALYAHKRTHLCDVCGQGFMSKANLRDHMNKHTGARPYACDLCPKRFSTAMLRLNHRAYHFPPKKMCTVCGKLFHSPSNLYVHMRTHIGNRCYKCDICGKGFLQNVALTEHKRGVHFNQRRVRKRGGAEAGVGAGEPGGSGGARGARTSAAARTKRRKRREAESSDSD